MSSVPLVIFIIISAFTMNLTLQCALGVKGIAESKNYALTVTFIKLGIIFFTVVLMWFMFSIIIFSIIGGIYIYIIIFPVSYMTYSLLEYFIFSYLLKNKKDESECLISFPEGATAAAAFLCVNIADSFLEAIMLSFGFTAGILLVIFILTEIKNRAALEAVPAFIRGKPLVLISMSLLSLVFSTASLIILRIVKAL